MMNCNWMVTLAVHNQKALISLGWAHADVVKLDAKEAEAELKKLGYNFKANSPFKSNKGTP